MGTTSILIIISIISFIIPLFFILKSKKNNKVEIKKTTPSNQNFVHSIEGLCDLINNTDNLADLNILKLFNLSIYEFNNASNMIKDNPQDVREKVKSVFIKTNINILNSFTKCVYKEYSDDSSSGFKKQTFLFTITDNCDNIMRIYSIITEKFGDCYYREGDAKFSIENIEKIANGKTKSEKDECHAIWLFKDLTFRLQYHINPAKQFVLNILQK